MCIPSSRANNAAMCASQQSAVSLACFPLLAVCAASSQHETYGHATIMWLMVASCKVCCCLHADIAGVYLHHILVLLHGRLSDICLLGCSTPSGGQQGSETGPGYRCAPWNPAAVPRGLPGLPAVLALEGSFCLSIRIRQQGHIH